LDAENRVKAGAEHGTEREQRGAGDKKSKRRWGRKNRDVKKEEREKRLGKDERRKGAGGGGAKKGEQEDKPKTTKNKNHTPAPTPAPTLVVEEGVGVMKKKRYFRAIVAEGVVP